MSRLPCFPSGDLIASHPVRAERFPRWLRGPFPPARSAPPFPPPFSERPKHRPRASGSAGPGGRGAGLMSHPSPSAPEEEASTSVCRVHCIPFLDHFSPV